MIIKRPIKYAIIIDRQGDCGVFDTMNDAIQLASVASEEYSKYSTSRKNEIIKAVTKKLETHLEELSLMTFKETGIDSYDNILYNNTVALNNSQTDKYLEARLAANNKLNNYDDSSCIVNGVIVSSSNPIETIIKNTILMLKAGNAVVFSSNKISKNVFAYTIKLINNAIESVTGPKNLIVTVKEPNDENTNIMVEHEKIILLSATKNLNTEKIAL